MPSQSGTERKLAERVLRGIKRLSEPKELYRLNDEEIALPDGFWREPLCVRKAMAYRATLQRLRLPIYDGELIVGDVPYCEFKANKDLITSYFAEDERERLHTKAREEYFALKGQYPPDFRSFLDVFHTCANYGHIIADYALPLRIGFGGMMETVNRQLIRARDQDKIDFLCSVKIALEGATEYIRRYGAEAARLAGLEPDPARKTELEKIATDCAVIADQPAGSFAQAVQLMWFTQLLMEIESGISAFSFGRVDKYLYPILKRDLERGGITLAGAQEIVDSFWVKANEQNNLTVDAGRAVTIGGTDGGGALFNDMTLLLLNSAIGTRLLQPKINARFCGDTPEEYARLCAEGAAKNAGVQMYNDEVILQSLVEYGYPHQDAADYGIIGCYEYGLAGIDRPSPMSVTFHLGKCFERALFSGGYDSYQTLCDALAREVSDNAAFMSDSMLFDELECALTRPLPFLSALVGDCVASAVDISRGGARFKTAGVRFTGFSAVADSLTAMKKLVFDERRIELGRLLAALKANFENAEPLRQMLINKAPKYGNDDDEADETAVRLGELCCRKILKLGHIGGAPLRPGLFSFLGFLDAGKNCGAFPNGRRAGEPFANGVSPMHGADREGPTAMLASAAKLNYRLAPNGATLDLKLQGGLYGRPGAYDQLAGVIIAYFQQGGAQVQAYSLTARDLEEARRDPAKHAELLVRVTGYSAYFVTLDDALKDEIIKRTASFAS